VDAADPGDEVLVTNGVYDTGGRPIYGVLTNRVAIYKPLTVRSVNGPDLTVIKGFAVTGLPQPEWYKAARCVYITNDAVLVGFCLTNGHVWIQAGDQRDRCVGGAYCEANGILSNCLVQGNSGYDQAGGVFQGICYNCNISNNVSAGNGGGAVAIVLVNCLITANRQQISAYGAGRGVANCLVTNCLISGNSAAGTLGGGGAYSSTLENCTLIQNYTTQGGGGGAYGGVLRGCNIVSNSATAAGGGGTYGSTVENSTITGNSTPTFTPGWGGGARFGGLSNCTISYNSGYRGGGASEVVMDHCRIIGNSAYDGGATRSSTLLNCTVVSNTGIALHYTVLTNCTVTGNFGPAYSSTFANCILYYNGGVEGSNYDQDCYLTYCCTTPMPTNGIGNISVDPLFAGPSLTDLHLQPNSPCINSGFNAAVATATDLDGSPRITGGTVDIGAYEFPNPASVISYAWLQRHGLSTDGSADVQDPDGNGMNNRQEWICDTDRMDAGSVLRIASVHVGTNGVSLTWQSADTRAYFIQRAPVLTRLADTFSTVATDIPGSAGTTSYNDTNAPAGGTLLYRVGVQQ
jgi:hypothetical protein